jgi:hypothetical protein
MHKSATKCNKTVGKWCKNKHGASKIIDTLETYQASSAQQHKTAKELYNLRHARARNVVERTFGLWKKKWAILRSTCFFRIADQVTYVHMLFE